MRAKGKKRCTIFLKLAKNQRMNLLIIVGVGALLWLIENVEQPQQMNDHNRIVSQ
jgi:hypothetical protein